VLGGYRRKEERGTDKMSKDPLMDWIVRNFTFRWAGKSIGYTYIEELVYFLPVLCLASSDQHQLALKISEII